MMKIRTAALALAALAFGCHERRPEPPVGGPPPASSAPREAATEAPGSAATTPAGAAISEGFPPAEAGCAVAARTGPAQSMKVGKRGATLEGTTLTFQGTDPDGKLVLGVLGPINEASGENLVALRKDEAFFEKNHADAIVVTGDVGEISGGIERAIAELARTQLPVLVVIGNRECRGDFNEGLKAAQKRFSNVVNLDEIREVRFPEATLVSLPGYHDPNYINCDTGCRYAQGTLHDVLELARASKAPVVLVSHGPPKGEGSQAIDYAESGGNVGDAQINNVIERGHIAFGVFSNIKEAGGRATDLEGTTRIPEDTWASSLYLNPGPAGAEGWRMNDGSTGHGFAAVLTVKDDQAAWKLFAAPKLTPAELKQARALEDEVSPARPSHPRRKKR